MKPEPNITRMDYARSHGWWVRFQRGSPPDRVITSKLFSDGQYGGKRKALIAARAWRDQMAPALPRSKRRNLIVAPPGHGYVRRCKRWRRASWQVCYVGWLRIENRRAKCTSRSVRLYGEKGAKRMAEEWLARERAALQTRMRQKRAA